jgi:N-methylhydantoinase A
MFDPASGITVEAKLLRRDTLSPGHCLDGPAILTEDETSTVVPPNYRVMINALGEIELLRKEG